MNELKLKAEDITYLTYEEYEKDLDMEMQQASESFVRIGYKLKIALETDILKGSEYYNINDFAKQRYGLDPSQVSRFININNRFSENGNSPYLKEQYRGIGYAKLAIMLQLPDSINEEITPAFSKSEIQAIKDEVDAEKQKSEIEIWMEGTPENGQEGTLANVLFQLGHDEKGLYTEAYGILKGKSESGQEIKELQEALAPTGEGIYSVRIQGTGRLFLSIKDTGKPVTIANIRSNEKESHPWEQLVEAWKHIMAPADTPEASWETVYGEPFGTEEKQEIAPVQQRKKPKVTKAKEEKKEIPAAVQEKVTENVTETEENVSKTEENVSETEKSVSKAEETATMEPETVPAAEEEQITGQTSIQEDFPQYMPKSGETAEDTDGENTHAAAGDSRMAAGYKEGITTSIRRIEYLLEQGRWQAVITEAKDIQWRAEQLMRLENKEVEEKEDADE